MSGEERTSPILAGTFGLVVGIGAAFAYSAFTGDLSEEAFRLMFAAGSAVAAVNAGAAVVTGQDLILRGVDAIFRPCSRICGYFSRENEVRTRTEELPRDTGATMNSSGVAPGAEAVSRGRMENPRATQVRGNSTVVNTR